MNPVIASISLRFGLGGLLLSSLYILIFGYDSIAIPLHTITVTLYSATLFSLCLLLVSALKNKLIGKSIVFVMCFVFLFVLASIYVSSFLSSYFWSEPMYDSLLINSFSLLLEYYPAYFSHILELLKIFISGKIIPGSLGLVIYSLTAGLFVFAILIILIIWLSKKITSLLSQPRTEIYTLSSLKKLSAACLLITLITQIFFIKIYAVKNWRGEQFIDTFFSESHNPFTEPYREHFAQHDREIFNTTVAKKGNGQNLVLIIIDAMRGNYIYDPKYPPPFITKLISEHKLQTEDLVYSTCSYSLCGIMGIVASKNVVELNPENVKIQEILKKSGYETYSIMSGFPDWYGMKDIYEKTYDTYIDSDINKHETHLDDLITDTLPTFNLQNTQPFFLYLRLMSTHEYGRQKPQFMEISRYEYANRVLQADDYVRQIFETLDKKGVLKNSTIIITGDHGHSQGEKHEYGHNMSLYHNQLHIPIMIYDESMHYPKLKFASSLDIAPTLLDRAGIDIPEYLNGISILRNNNQDRMLFHSKAGAQHQTDRMRAVTYLHGDKVYKYIYTGAKRFSISPKKEELYEITTDPEENHNLIGSIDPEIFNKMKAAYEEHFRD